MRKKEKDFWFLSALSMCINPTISLVVFSLCVNLKLYMNTLNPSSLLLLGLALLKHPLALVHHTLFLDEE